MSTVSVVIPAYNAERSIRAAIDSVLSQTVPAYEVLVIDDGSQDGTAQTVQDYGDKVRLVRQANGGPSRARNRGAELATGDFIAFLDADDTWREDKLEKQLAAMQVRPDAVLCYTSMRQLLPGGGERIDNAFPADKVASRLRMCNPGITPSAVLLRRSSFLAVNGFDNLQNGCEDWGLWFRLSRLGPFCVVQEPVTVYLVSNTGFSSDADRVFNDFDRMLDNLLLRDLRGVHRALWRRKIMAYQAYAAALTARGAGEYKKGWNYLMRSAAAWPSPLWYPERFRTIAVALLKRKASR